MAQLFLGSVGVAEAFINQNGKAVSVFSANTLTDSSITLGVSAEDVRGGVGAKLLGKFFHTSTFDMSLTDAIFKLDYLKLQVGAQFNKRADLFTTETATGAELVAGKVLAHTPVRVIAGTQPIVMYRKTTDSEWSISDSIEGTTLTIAGAEASAEYCLKYLYTDAAAKQIIVGANFVPSEVCLYLTANLYAGEAIALETGKPAGTITIQIPRFQLDGNVELSMAMASAATIALKGSALANNEGCNEAWYGKIVQLNTGAVWSDGLTALLVEDAERTVAQGSGPITLNVYGVFKDAIPSLADNKDLTFTAETGKEAVLSVGEHTGVVTIAGAGTATITVTATDNANVEPGIAIITVE